MAIEESRINPTSGGHCPSAKRGVAGSPNGMRHFRYCHTEAVPAGDHRGARRRHQGSGQPGRWGVMFRGPRAPNPAGGLCFRQQGLAPRCGQGGHDVDGKSSVSLLRNAHLANVSSLRASLIQSRQPYIGARHGSGKLLCIRTDYGCPPAPALPLHRIGTLFAYSSIPTQTGT